MITAAIHLFALIFLLGSTTSVSAQVAAPDLVTPEDGGWRWIDDELTWTEVEGATLYRVQVAPIDVEFGETIVDSVLSQTYVYSRLEEGQYEWQVAASDGEAWSDWSDAWTFESRFPVSNEPEPGMIGEILKIKVYPNPTDRWIILEIDNALPATTRIIAYDLLGRGVLERTLSVLTIHPNTIRIDFDGMASGVYVLQVTQGSHRASSLFVKN